MSRCRQNVTCPPYTEPSLYPTWQPTCDFRVSGCWHTFSPAARCPLRWLLPFSCSICIHWFHHPSRQFGVWHRIGGRGCTAAADRQRAADSWSLSALPRRNVCRLSVAPVNADFNAGTKEHQVRSSPVARTLLDLVHLFSLNAHAQPLRAPDLPHTPTNNSTVYTAASFILVEQSLRISPSSTTTDRPSPSISRLQLSCAGSKIGCLRCTTAIAARAMTNYSTFSNGSGSGSDPGEMARYVLLLHCGFCGSLDRSPGYAPSRATLIAGSGVLVTTHADAWQL